MAVIRMNKDRWREPCHRYTCERSNCCIISHHMECDTPVFEKLALKIFRRVFVKLFGIAGFLLALIGGALIGYSALTSGGLSPTSIVIRAFEALLAIGGIMIYTGPMRLGGIVAVLGGIMLLIITGFATSAILVFAAGIIGIIGAAMKPPWWKFWKR